MTGARSTDGIADLLTSFCLRLNQEQQPYNPHTRQTVLQRKVLEVCLE
jgi:hypothetical protein